MADTAEKLVSAAGTVAIAGAGIALMERAGKVGQRRGPIEEKDQERFLRTWWRLHPQTYKKYHKDHGGRSRDMVQALTDDARRSPSSNAGRVWSEVTLRTY